MVNPSDNVITNSILNANGHIAGTAQSGTTTTLVDTELGKLSDAEAAKYAGGTAVISGYPVNIVSITPSTNTMVFEENSPLTVGTDTKYTAIKSSGSASSAGEPSATVTRPNDTTAYAIGDVVGTNPATNIELTNVISLAGGHFMILGADLQVAVNAVPSGMSSFRVHLYSSAPAAIADNTAWSLPSADAGKYLGYIEIATPADRGDVLVGTVENLAFKRKLAASSTSLFAMIETRGAYTPTAQAVKTLTLHVIGV